MRHLKRVISYLSCLLTEDSSEQSFLSGKLSLSLRSYLTYEYIARAYLSTDSDNTVFIKVLQSFLTYVRNISCDLLRSELGVSCLGLVFFNMNRCVLILLYKVFVQKNGVLVVVAFPCHEADKGILTEGELSVCSSRTVTDDLMSLYPFALINDRSLVGAGASI